MKITGTTCLFMLVALTSVSWGQSAIHKPSVSVEIEEQVYPFDRKGAETGPMWCSANTSIVRVNGEVFASGNEIIPGAKPQNNQSTFLLHRTDSQWRRVFSDRRRTREPAPLAMYQDGRILLSVNPTLTHPDTYAGPSQPAVFEFHADSIDEAPHSLAPTWQGNPPFEQHSYRSFVADGERGELILLQNAGYAQAEWSFRDAQSQWSAQGQLVWPWGAEYAKPKPIRLCYPAVSLNDRRIDFIGVGDITEPNGAWANCKQKISGREWDYVFRRLFYTWSDDITTGKFHDWVEIASREKTAGHLSGCDLYLAPNKDVFILWHETALDVRLRRKFFPQAKQRYALECAVLRNGKVVHRSTIAEAGDGLGGTIPGKGHFHVSADGRLFVVYYQGGVNHYGGHLSENRIVELNSRGVPGNPATIPLDRPFMKFFTTTVRAGCQPSNVLDLFGLVRGNMRYARIRIQ